MPARQPAFTRSVFPAPIFWAVKLEMPLPSVVKQVMVKVFSFTAVKNLTTAEGGVLTWRTIDGIDDEEIYHQLQLLSLHGLKQLERYPKMLERRKEIIRRYDEALRPLGIQTLDHYRDEYESSGHLYITRVPNITAEQRNEIITKMAEQGVATNVHYKPLPMHTAYKKLGFDIKDYPNAYRQYANEITLPLHTCLSDEQVELVINEYRKAVESVR